MSPFQPKPTNTNGWIYAQSHAEVFCREAERFWGNSLVNTKPDATYHLDRRLLTSASPKAANNFRRLAKTPLLTRLARNNRDCKNVENLPISPLICRAQNLLPPAKTAASPPHPKGFSAFSGQLTSQPSLTRVREIRWGIIHEHKQNRCRSYDLPRPRWRYRLSSTRGPQLDRNQRCNGRIPCLPKISWCRQGGLRCVASKAVDRFGPLRTFGPKSLNIALHSFEIF